jgi:hypothetical protein
MNEHKFLNLAGMVDSCIGCWKTHGKLFQGHVDALELVREQLLELGGAERLHSFGKSLEERA